MQKIIYAAYSIVLYLASWILIGYIVVVSPKLITKYYVMDNITMMKISVLIIFSICIATILLLSIIKKKELRELVIHLSVGTLAFLYIIFSMYILFFTRHTITFDINLLPFRNIIPMTYGILSGDSYSMTNLKSIIYHICLFIPLGGFLYFYSNKLRAFNRYFLATGGGILVLSILQFFIKVNTFDIDHIILSLLGILLVYTFMKKFYTPLKEGKKDEIT